MFHEPEGEKPFIDRLVPSKEGVAELREMYRRRFKKELTDEEATDILTRLTRFLWVFVDRNIKEEEQRAAESLRERTKVGEQFSLLGELHYEHTAEPTGELGGTTGTADSATPENNGREAGGWPGDGPFAIGLLRDPG